MFEQSLCFIEELEKLKKIERMNLVLGGERRENSAEHSWHSAMTLWVLKRYIPWEDVEWRCHLREKQTYSPKPR